MAKQIQMLQDMVKGHSKTGTVLEKDSVKLTQVSESDDMEAYLTTFKRVMQAHEIDMSRWAYKLAPQLTGKAQQAYAVLGSEDARSYALVKAVILRRYNINEETYRKRFRSLTLKPGETPVEMVTRLNDLATKWLKDNMSADEIRDAVVKEQLLTSLPEHIRIWVSERKPKTSEEAGQLAEDYRQAHSTQMQPPGRCPKCGESGHWAKDCTRHQESSKQPKRFKCNVKGNLSYHCPQRSSLYCDVPAGGFSGFTVAEAHESLKQGLINDQPCKILLDTGTTQSMVHSDLITDDDLLNESTTVRCAHGDSVTYPLAPIAVRIGGKKMQLCQAPCLSPLSLNGMHPQSCTCYLSQGTDSSVSELELE